MRNRKLIVKHYLNEYASLRQLGVPIRKIIRDNDLDISGPHLSKLLDWVDELNQENNTIIHDSLFPQWLDTDGDKVQEQPIHYNYSGRFPKGRWILNESN